MSQSIEDARRNISTILEALFLKQNGYKYEICNGHEDDSLLYDLYRAAIHHLENHLGVPTYTGKGGAYGIVESNPGIFISEYSHSLEITWWRHKSETFVLLISGHDADTLLCFSAEYYNLTA